MECGCHCQHTLGPARRNAVLVKGIHVRALSLHVHQKVVHTERRFTYAEQRIYD